MGARQENSQFEVCPRYPTLVNKACPQRFRCTRTWLTWGGKLPTYTPHAPQPLCLTYLKAGAQTQKHLWGSQDVFSSWQEICAVISKPFLHLPDTNWLAYNPILPPTRVNHRLYSLRAQFHKLPTCQMAAAGGGSYHTHFSIATNVEVPRTRPHVC